MAPCLVAIGTVVRWRALPLHPPSWALEVREPLVPSTHLHGRAEALPSLPTRRELWLVGNHEYSAAIAMGTKILHIRHGRRVLPH